MKLCTQGYNIILPSFVRYLSLTFFANNLVLIYHILILACKYHKISVADVRHATDIINGDVKIHDR